MGHLDAELPVRDVFARKILDCAGYPAIEAEVLAGESIVGRASAPAGGRPAEDPAQLSDAADRMVENINTRIAQELIGKNVFEQEEIDRVMSCREKAGSMSGPEAGAAFCVSAAAAKAAAAALGQPLYRYLGGVQPKKIPVPAVPVIGGSPCVKGMDLQEIMLIPAGCDTLREQLEAAGKIIRMLGKICAVRGIEAADGGENGLLTGLRDIRENLRLVRSAAEQAGYRWGREITVGINAAAEKLYDANKKCYRFLSEGKEKEICRNTREMIDYYEELASEFPVSSIEEPLAPEDREGWAGMTERLGGKIQIAGESIFREKSTELKKEESTKYVNAVCIRCGQQGTLTGLSRMIKTVREAGCRVVIGCDCRKTCETAVCDIAVAFGAEQVRFGTPMSMENAENYNRLLRIAEKLE